MTDTVRIALLQHQTPQVAAQMYTIWQRSYRIEAELLGATDFPPLRRTAVDLQGSTNAFWGCFADDTLVGVLELATVDATTLHIQSLVVDPDHFRRGHARRLMQHAIDQPDWTTLFVETGAANVPAITLYERLGLTLTDRWMTDHGIEKVRLHRQRTAPTV